MPLPADASPPVPLDRPDLLPLPLTNGPALARWALYGTFWTGLGILQAIAELQHYLRRGGEHPWEPFLWELSSVWAIALLTVALYRWHRRLWSAAIGVPRRVAGHVLGAAVFVLAHSALMYGLRAAAYAATGVAYEPGSVPSVLGYEGAKDLVSYTLLVGLCHSVLLLQRDRARQAELVRLQTELDRAQLQRLQQQVHPHFLFNTLNLVSSAMHEDVERADRIVSDLAEVLRHSLDAGRAPTHTVAEELAIVQPFLSIMRQRFGPRLDVRCQVEPAALACTVPSLLLIAPVENAVTHGVAQTSAPVSVRVEGRVAQCADGRTLELCVRDSAGQFGTAGRAGGTGLDNLRARLRMTCGPGASADLGRDGSDTVLRIRLPAIVPLSDGTAALPR